ncbi:hypothetical protein NHJ13734_006802 [Beauveria thailandica]
MYSSRRLVGASATLVTTSAKLKLAKASSASSTSNKTKLPSYRAISACGIPPTATKGVSVCRGGDAHTHAHTHTQRSCEHSLQHAGAVSSS